MRVDELHYELPSELIARHPTERRDEARLMVVGRDGVEHRFVHQLAELLPRGALLVVNDTRVLPARLMGRKLPSGGKVEVLLVRELDDADASAPRWLALAKSSRRIKPRTQLALDGGLNVVVEGGPDDEGLFTVRVTNRSAEELMALLDAVGRVPLPPYLGRDEQPDDRVRYQTLFARRPGAVAAPTAGLHFSEELLSRLEARGIARAVITLHVGPGTFRPVKVADLAQHPMHAERYAVDGDAVAAVAAARARGAPVVAVGTTVVRALESAADPERMGLLRPVQGETRLLIQPGYRFRVVDALITNFHLPASTLLALVYAFGGRARVAQAYQRAIEQRYRFYSYGDAMYLPVREDAPSTDVTA